jgi:hypothetical protein
MSEWLSAAWFGDALDIVAQAPIGFGITGSLQCDVTGGPDGDVTCHWTFRDGRLTDVALGPVDQADVVLTVVRADALSMQRGELDPNVAFMQGRLKVAGSMELMLNLLKWARTAEGQALVGRMAEGTQF